MEWEECVDVGISIEVRCYIYSVSTMHDDETPHPLFARSRIEGERTRWNRERVEVIDVHVITNTGYVTKGLPRSSGFAVSGTRRLDRSRVSSRFDSFDRKRTVASFRSRNRQAQNRFCCWTGGRGIIGGGLKTTIWRDHGSKVHQHR